MITFGLKSGAVFAVESTSDIYMEGIVFERPGQIIGMAKDGNPIQVTIRTVDNFYVNFIITEISYMSEN